MRKGQRWSRRVLEAKTTHRIVNGLAKGLVAITRAVGRNRMAGFAAGLLKLIGPLFPEHRLARRNLALAFPEKSAAERERILSGVWENLARTGVEFFFLDEFVASFDPDRPGSGQVTVAGIEHFYAIRASGRPAVLFSAHLANWELSAAIAGRNGLPLSILYRTPSNASIGADILRQREAMMGELVDSTFGAAFALAKAIQRGRVVGVLTDQRVTRAPVMPFFGRPAHSNDVVARLARAHECPVHGARTIRLPGGRFHIEVTPPIDLPRDAEGKVDVALATATINDVIEGWVREYPDQWLWLHDRWKLGRSRKRDDD